MLSNQTPEFSSCKQQKYQNQTLKAKYNKNIQQIISNTSCTLEVFIYHRIREVSTRTRLNNGPRLSKVHIVALPYIE